MATWQLDEVKVAVYSILTYGSICDWQSVQAQQSGGITSESGELYVTLRNLSYMKGSVVYSLLLYDVREGFYPQIILVKVDNFT